MKKKNLFVMALAALTFASCSTDDNSGMGENAPDGTAMHAQLSIRFDENTTRADGDKDAGNASEGISDGATLNVIVYKNDVVENIKTFELAATETTTASFPTTAGPKKVVVIANLPADLVASLPSVNDPISNLYALQADLVTATPGEVDKIDVDKKFTMSGIEETTFTVTAGEGDTKDTPLDVPVTINRLAAKINLGIADAIPRTGILAADKADVDFVKVADGSGNKVPPHFALQLTHKYANILPETKDAFTSAGTATGDPATSYGDIVTADPLSYKTASADFTTVAYGSSNYCPANYNENPETRNSTMAAIKLQLKPKKEMIVTADGSGYKTTYEIATFTDGDFFGFVYKGVTYAPFSTSAKATAAYEVINGSAAPAVAVEKWITGLAYYKIYVGDRASDDPKTKYSVLANRVYQIKVSSISGFGSSDEEGIIDPPGPIEKDAHITATITVEDWDLVQFSEGNQ